MKKNFGVVIFTVAMSAFLGCSAGKTEVDSQALANDLLNNISYEDELTDIGLDTAKMIFNFQDASITEGYFYEGSGGTAEEIVVVKCSSTEDAKKVVTSLETRVDEQIECFTDYVPKELEKLDTAIIQTVGDTVVLSVSNDPKKAKEIIDSCTK